MIRIEIKAVTWGKDSHGLFDYEYSQYIMKRFTFNENVSLYRIADEVSCNQPQEMPQYHDNINNTEFLLSICKKNAQIANKYCIEVANQNQGSNIMRKHNIYLIVRSLKDQQGKSQVGFALKPGNVIKLGRIEYRVVEIRSETDTKSDANFTNQMDETEFEVESQIIPKDTEMMCRYCLYDQKDNDVDHVDKALLFCCLCSGSAGGVHFSCLKNWIKNKIVSKTNNNTVTYQWKKFECEVCKTQLPRKVIFKNQANELINIERPDCPYIILEKIPGANEPQKGATLSLIVPTENETIKLGRGHQCDLRISDISVSRIHAFLRYINGEFKIYDNESKFGTLILLNDDYEITRDKAAIQIGRTVFTFVMKDTVINNNMMDREIG